MKGFKPEAKDSLTHYDSPAPPPCSGHSWALMVSGLQRPLSYFSSRDVSFYTPWQTSERSWLARGKLGHLMLFYAATEPVCLSICADKCFNQQQVVYSRCQYRCASAWGQNRCTSPPHSSCCGPRSPPSCNTHTHINSTLILLWVLFSATL